MYAEIEKPWGKEELIEVNQQYVLKRLTMKAGHRCSLQYHQRKCETIYVLSGSIRVLLGSSVESLSVSIFNVNESLTINPGIIHRMEALEDSVYLEASTPEIDDVVRLSDDYNRLAR